MEEAHDRRVSISQNRYLQPTDNSNYEKGCRPPRARKGQPAQEPSPKTAVCEGARAAFICQRDSSPTKGHRVSTGCAKGRSREQTFKNSPCITGCLECFCAAIFAGGRAKREHHSKDCHSCCSATRGFGFPGTLWLWPQAACGGTSCL